VEFKRPVRLLKNHKQKQSTTPSNVMSMLAPQSLYKQN
jgi:hypothetical protein